MRRRDFIQGIIGAAAAWPHVVRAQQPMPTIGLISPGSADANARNAAAFRKGLSETGYVEGQNVTVEYHWLDGPYDQMSALMTDLVRRRVAVIATPSIDHELEFSRLRKTGRSAGLVPLRILPE